VCGDDHPGKMRGKPEPDIFLMAAREKLGRKVGDCTECSEEEKKERRKGLVFEDAIPGMQAGKRAGMSVVWVPDAKLLDVEFTSRSNPEIRRGVRTRAVGFTTIRCIVRTSRNSIAQTCV